MPQWYCVQVGEVAGSCADMQKELQHSLSLSRYTNAACVHLSTVQVLRLADRLQATACVQAAVAAQTGTPMTLNVAMAAFMLPPCCVDNPDIKPVTTAAATTLQQTLGDLETVLADGAKWRQLLQLPLPALRHLLRDPVTRAASENTVFWTVCGWLQKRFGGSTEEQASLVACIRLHQATAMYLPSVLGQSVWLRQHRSDLQLAVAWRSAPAAFKAAAKQDYPVPAAAAAAALGPQAGPAGLGRAAGRHQAQGRGGAKRKAAWFSHFAAAGVVGWLLMEAPAVHAG